MSMMEPHVQQQSSCGYNSAAGAGADTPYCLSRNLRQSMDDLAPVGCFISQGGKLQAQTESAGKGRECVKIHAHRGLSTWTTSAACMLAFLCHRTSTEPSRLDTLSAQISTAIAPLSSILMGNVGKGFSGGPLPTSGKLGSLGHHSPRTSPDFRSKAVPCAGQTIHPLCTCPWKRAVFPTSGSPRCGHLLDTA